MIIRHIKSPLPKLKSERGLLFDYSIYEANPLYFSETNTKPEENVIILPEEIEIAKPQDLVSTGDQRRTIAMPDPTGADTGNEWVILINLGS
jgi:hypothetical protein